MRTSTGLPTEAVYIFHNMVRKLIADHHPEHIAAVFESSGPTFREQEFADYKATRAEMPPDLSLQIPYVRRLLEAMRIPILEYQGFEADDVIGTIARRAEQSGIEVVIVSSDKDMLQLVSGRISMFNPIKENIWYDPAKVEEFMGVPPERVADLLALKGDAIDNIPGAPGIGEKGARDLITRFGSVETLIDHASEVERRTYRESLEVNRERILLSKRLATIDTTVPIKFSLDDAAAGQPDLPALRRIYKELEFYSLLKELGLEEDTRPRDYCTLESAAAIREWLAAIPAGAPVAIAVVLESASATQPQFEENGQRSLLSVASEPAQGVVALSWKSGEARAVPFALLDSLRPFLEDATRAKIAHDVKPVLLALSLAGIEAKGFTEDVMLYAFLLSAEPSGCSLEVVVRRYLDRKVEAAAEHQADCILEAAEKLRREVDARGFREIYERIDLPLVAVLARMERTGIRIDPGELQRLSRLMEGEIQRLTAEIHAASGKPFNINSPQQLGKILFEDLNLPAPVKYGKGKIISTAADILEELAVEHEIARKVLEYRQLAKLKGTYVDALPALVNPATGRLHTSFNQTGAATGRLSSSNPNLQNIPIRSELGREIRAAFVPREGWKLIVADYSQIELRLLAHFAGCSVLQDAFRRGEDIHTRTASEVFGVPPLMVDSEMRRRAKAVNFGIVYGLSAFGLAGQLGISRQEAQTYIDNYFERYSGVKLFIESTIAAVRAAGVTKTLFGRERPIPDINSRNPNARSFAERTAVNTPLQGTAADLIKLAMIRIEAELRKQKLSAEMLLQVHDELLFEAPPEEVEIVSKLVKTAMENVHRLAVPLIAEIGVGDNWRDAK